jgi:hypothetical protein
MLAFGWKMRDGYHMHIRFGKCDHIAMCPPEFQPVSAHRYLRYYQS